MSDATKSCPFCGEEILAVAKKCRHCSSVLDSSILSTQDKPADYGFFLLIPIITTFLVFFWVGNTNLLQSPSAALMLILLATVLSTATLAALEVIKLAHGVILKRHHRSS